jgi:predicted phage terminase large subunit-like protein
MVSYFVSEFCLQGHFVKFDYYELLASTCRDSYFEFVKQFWHTIVKDPLVCNWHIKYLCDTIQESMERVFRGENSPNDLLVNISPGTSKSTLFSVMLVPWAWTRMPHLRMIGASYTDALALDLSGKSRQIVESALYQKTFPNIRLSKDTNSKSHWANTYNGDRYAVAVGGSVTGMHAHIIVIDDPINPREVRSKADLETAKNWCKETISSRKVNKDLTPTFVVMQRLHQDDPSTLYIERGESAVRHICLPGEITPAVKPESLRAYYQNNLFDPVRLSRPTLDRMQVELGQFGYSGQILQDPIPLGGGMFKPERINIVEYPMGYDFFTKVVRYWDKACLIAGTKVLCQDGIKNIEDVQIGNKVWTKEGWNPVYSSGMTKKTDQLVTVILSDGRAVTGTADHEILTVDGYWVELASLCGGDLLEAPEAGNKTWQDPETLIWNMCCSKAEDTPGNQDVATSSVTNGISKTSDTKTDHCIETSGNHTINAAYPKAIIYTTLTETSITIRRKIYDASLHRNIGSCTNLSIVDTWKPTVSGLSKIENALCQLYETGSRLPKTIQTLSKQDPKEVSEVGIPHSSQSSYASNVELPSKAEPKCPPHSAVVSARINLDQKGKKSSEKSSAKCVESPSPAIDELVHVPLSAEKTYAPVAVFDLSVRNCPQFLANGIIVHNCTNGGGDWSVGVKMGLHKDGSYWILDICRGQWSSDDRERQIVACAHRDGKSVRIGIEREPGSSGVDSVKDSVKRLSGFRVYPNLASGKKELRADTFSVQVNAGNVYMVKGAYNTPYLEELAYFPNGKHDDQVDASSGAFSMLDKQRTRLGIL